MELNTIIQGDAREVLKTLPDKSIHCCVTSPPYYGLRDYGVDGQIGLEETPEEYVENMVEIFRRVRRVLRPDGTLWLNLGDSYAGSGMGAANYPGDYGKQNSNKGSLSVKGRAGLVPDGLKPKDLIGIPWRVAFALQGDGWYLRADIIWSKPNSMPESVTDRPTKAHEYIFLLSKSQRYYYDFEIIKEPTITRDNSYRDRDDSKLNNTPGRTRMGGLKTNNYEMRNKRSVWTVPTKPFSEAHFAVFPPKLIEPCILAGCPVGGIVLDPFMGSGTTALVAFEHERNYLGIELNPEYIKLANRRLERRKIQGLQVSILGR